MRLPAFPMWSPWSPQWSTLRARNLDAFRSFLQSTRLAGHLQTQNWTAFARGYNGADFQRYHYDQKLEAAYKLFNSGSLPNLDIRAAQLYLTVKGFSPDGIDGVLGPRTKAAIQAFQASMGLPQTGQLDRQTMSALPPARLVLPIDPCCC
jgi:hypothetical protein